MNQGNKHGLKTKYPQTQAITDLSDPSSDFFFLWHLDRSWEDLQLFNPLHIWLRFATRNKSSDLIWCYWRLMERKTWKNLLNKQPVLPWVPPPTKSDTGTSFAPCSDSKKSRKQSYETGTEKNLQYCWWSLQKFERKEHILLCSLPELCTFWSFALDLWLDDLSKKNLIES